MKATFLRSFARDLRGIRDRSVGERIREAIELVEHAQRLNEVAGVKRLSGATGYYRIRVGDYRIGLALEEDMVTFVRVLHRREIYRWRIQAVVATLVD